MSGKTVCGDMLHADVCLYRIDCEDVDPLLLCTEDDPVWMSDGMTTGSGTNKKTAFHLILFGFADLGSHPNARSIDGASVHRIVSTPTFWKLPRATAGYTRDEGAATHAAHCGRQYCAIPKMLYNAYDDSVASEKDIAFPSSKKQVCLTA